MINAIKTDAILIAEDAFSPKFALFESAPYVYEWRVVKNVGSEFGSK
jgi:hypothetical protein